jgi:tRNA U34 5-carboxymethylaminomethyl modifying GTPase MnmE/TrmE
MSTEFELFSGTNFSDLMRDVYHNSKKKSRQIDTLIKSLEPMIKNVGDATVIVPLIKDYLEVSVKNDDALVKLAAVVQRLVSASNKEDDGNEFGLSEEERKRLLEEAEAEIENIQETNKPEQKIDVISTKLSDLSSSRD